MNLTATHPAALSLVVACAGLVAAPVVPPQTPAAAHLHGVRLTGGEAADFAPGDATAFVMGGTGFSLPIQRFADTAAQLYLQPHGFTGTQGTPQYTPASGDHPYLFSHKPDPSVTEGAHDLVTSIHDRIDAGGVSADNPIYVFGYSQSAVVANLAMKLLSQGPNAVPSDDVHFVLVGDTGNPLSGLLERMPGLYPTFGGPPDAGLYPTDVYTLEYDGWADFPKYPISRLADLNALMGMVFMHSMYLGLTPEQLKPVADGGDAVLLPGSMDLGGDGLTNYWMIPVDNLPLLEPLRWIPIIGNPMADLVQPVLKVLVNLGYGSATEGWATGPMGLFPTDVNWGEVFTALLRGVGQGIYGAIRDLLSPANYHIGSIMEGPTMSAMADSLYAMGVVSSPDATLGEVLKGAFQVFFGPTDAPTDAIPDPGEIAAPAAAELAGAWDVPA